MTKKALVYSKEGTILTFNKNNKWETTELTKDTLTDQNFIDQGFDYDLLASSITDIYVNFIDMGVLDSTGEDTRHLYLTEDIDKALGVTGYTLDDSDDTQYRMQLTIPAFLPKDQLTAGYQVLVYDDDTAYIPEILNTVFSATTTHDSNINLTMTIQYLYNKKVKYRITIGDNVSEWSSEQESGDIVATILPARLQVGDNTIKIEVADSTDETKVGTLTLENAINQSDAVPAINVIGTDSGSFYLHFIVNDADLGDLLKYKLTISNSKGITVLQDWTDFKSNPLDINYQIDSTYVTPDSTNAIKIEVEDNYGKGSSATYTFTGEYKNILFCDENGGYYTTDKGVLLKLLDFGKIFSGRISEVKKVTLKNNNPYDITNITIKIRTDDNAVVGSHVELAKVNNPFTALEDGLDFGNLVLGYKETIDFYIRVRADEQIEAVDLFDIDARAEKVA